MKTIVYPGTFDPVTLGHLDLLPRALNLFDRLIIAVSKGMESTLFTLEERIGLIERILEPEKGRQAVVVKGFDCLLVDFMKQNQVRFLLRGLRTVTDFEFEFQLANANRVMYPEIETVFLMPDEGLAKISSSLVREIAMLNGNITPFVHPVVEEALKRKFAAG